jgi:membrane associated rhomboid family serine protease
MGIADRAYMRGRRPVGPRFSATTWVLLALVTCFIVGLIGSAARVDFLEGFALSETRPLPWQPLTYVLIHGDFWHLLGNGLILWWTGDMVERTYGRRVFWWVLALGALIGAATWWATGLGGVRDGGQLIGASAAVYALMLVALLDKLDHQITLLLFFFLPVTLRVAWLLLITVALTLGGWAFAELPSRHVWAGWHPVWTSEIAHSAHLGGLLLGWFAFRWLNQTNLTVQGAQEEMAPPPPAAPEPDLVRYDDEETAAVAPLTRQQARTELDTLLDKISAQGFGSLSPAEKRRLEVLSARLR